jgi:trehalose-6-phosphate synthase
LNTKRDFLVSNELLAFKRVLLYRYTPAFTELCALYAVTDVCLVTSLRDGMNLVSYEFVSCQSKNAGVLVLSAGLYTCNLVDP